MRMSSEGTLPLNGESLQTVSGTVERVIFHNPANGFTVLRVAPETKGADAISCVGHTSQPHPGARVKLRGDYRNNPRFGRQFAFQGFEEIMPVSQNDIRSYLSSGLIKGVGPSMAEKIVQRFGDDTLRILDENPEQLREVRGIGEKTLEGIVESWKAHVGMRELMLFLQPQGVSPAYAARIFKAYGPKAREVLEKNPYRMAMDVRGIGFLTADAIAARLGFAPDNPLRVQAAALYILQRASEDGNVFLPEDSLVDRIVKQVAVSEEMAKEALLALEDDERIVREAQGRVMAVYLKRFHHCESRTSWYLRRLLASPKSIRFRDVDKALEKVLAELSITLAPRQIDAIRAATSAKILVITGGPGTGKTTIIKSLIRLFQKARAKIALAAPTGRAAKRMSEACEMDASTIHRLLEYSPTDDRFARNEDTPLPCDLLVVDEASMMDSLLFYYLLKAVPRGATLVLVGDIHQLPSVGPGNVLGDIIDSHAVPVVELNEIFRQSQESSIICNAHLINRGLMPLVEQNPRALSDFYFLPREDPDEAATTIVDLISSSIPAKFGLNPFNDVQLLTPMHKGAVGAELMNRRLQEALNPQGREVRKGDRIFRQNDKVMQIRNNYDKDIFNGDIGRIVFIDPHDRKISVRFDDVVKPYEFDELDELVPAYAISIHKSQGSEYPAVVIPIMMQHYILLQRNLIYTAVTRGKSLVVLVGERKALQIAIENNKTARRYTWLADRLQQAGQLPLE